MLPNTTEPNAIGIESKAIYETDFANDSIDSVITLT